MWVSWQGLAGRAFLPTPSRRCRISPFPSCSGRWPDFGLPLRQLLTDPLTVSWSARRTQPLGNLGESPPPLPVQDNVSTEENMSNFAFFSAKCNARGRATPSFPWPGKSRARSILLHGTSVGATGTFSYSKVPAPSGETPTSFLTGSA